MQGDFITTRDIGRNIFNAIPEKKESKVTEGDVCELVVELVVVVEILVTKNLSDPTLINAV